MAFPQKTTFFDDQNNLLISTRLNNSNNELINTKIGIYGWRKRCIYCLILIIVIVLFVNISLTAWILVSINFNYNGFIGNLKLTNDGLSINGQTVVLDELVAAKIASLSSFNRKNNHGNSDIIDIYTDKAIRFYTRNDLNKQLENTLTMNNDELKVNCNKFTVLNNNNETIFSVSNEYTILNTQELKYKNNNQSVSLQFENLEANKITSNNDLNIQTNNGSIRISSDDLALNGTILTFNSKNNLTINATKRITFQAEEIRIVRLPEFQPTNYINQNAVNNVMQLCLCKNGLLYAHNPDEQCSNDASLCQND